MATTKKQVDDAIELINTSEPQKTEMKELVPGPASTFRGNININTSAVKEVTSRVHGAFVLAVDWITTAIGEGLQTLRTEFDAFKTKITKDLDDAKTDLDERVSILPITVISSEDPTEGTWFEDTYKRPMQTGDVWFQVIMPDPTSGPDTGISMASEVQDEERPDSQE